MKSDGTVLAVGNNDYVQCDVADWRDIVAVSAGDYHTVGLKSDGTVVATKYTGVRMLYFGRCDVAGWKLFNNFSMLEAERAEQARRAEEEARRREEESRRAEEEARRRAEEETRRRAEEQARRAAEQARLAEQARQ